MYVCNVMYVCMYVCMEMVPAGDTIGGVAGRRPGPYIYILSMPAVACMCVFMLHTCAATFFTFPSVARAHRAPLEHSKATGSLTALATSRKTTT